MEKTLTLLDQLPGTELKNQPLHGSHWQWVMWSTHVGAKSTHNQIRQKTKVRTALQPFVGVMLVLLEKQECPLKELQTQPKARTCSKSGCLRGNSQDQKGLADST